MALYAHQQSFLSKCPPKSSLIWSCGTGKTLTALLWAKGSTLVICPKALKTNWQIESNKIKGVFKVLTKEEFRRDCQKIGHYHSVIVDEAHVGFLTPLWKSKMSKSLKRYLEYHRVPRVLLLTATPFTSSPWNVYNLAHLTGHQWNWREFRLRFFYDVQMGPRIVPVPKKGCEKELATMVRSIADVVNIRDVIDVPLQNHLEPELFALTRTQKTAIEEAYDPLPIVRFTRQHIIEQEGDKNERVKSLVAENPKIALVCRYTEQMDALASILKEYKPFIIRGDVSNRHEIYQEAESSPQAVVIIQADCGLGFELPSFPLCVFISQSYSYTSYEQMCGRFLRMNRPSRTTFMYLLTEGDSIDRAVYDAVRRKEDFKVELYGN